MGKINDFLSALKELGDGRYKYYNSATGTGIGCSDYVCYALRKAGIITTSESCWAGQSYIGVLADTTRFQKIDWNPTNLQAGDILWSMGHHVAVWAGDQYNSLYEAAPESTHSLATCGTGVGLHQGHTYYNCGTGTKTWTCIYRIIDNNSSSTTDTTTSTASSTTTQTIKLTMKILMNNSVGVQVKTLQYLLNTKVASNLSVDGIFGTKTYNAVVKFQTNNGLTANGIVNQETWKKLLS